MDRETLFIASVVCVTCLLGIGWFFNMVLAYIGGAVVKGHKAMKEWRYYKAKYNNSKKDWARSFGFTFKAVKIILKAACPIMVLLGCCVYVVAQFMSTTTINAMLSIPLGGLMFIGIGYISILFEGEEI